MPGRLAQAGWNSAASLPATKTTHEYSYGFSTAVPDVTLQLPSSTASVIFSTIPLPNLCSSDASPVLLSFCLCAGVDMHSFVSSKHKLIAYVCH